MFLTTLFWLLLVAYLARWIVSEWGERSAARLSPAADAEVARLRAEVDDLAAQLRRLSEEQSFMVSLLSEGGRRALEDRRAEASRALPPQNPTTGDS
jgi:hypothetical protein